MCAAVFVASVVFGLDVGRAETTRAHGAETSTSKSATQASAIGAVVAARGPFLDPQLSKRVAARVEGAIPVARRRLADIPSCRAMFERLGADGIAKLNATSYYPARADHERKYCRHGSLAMTKVGASTVGLCRSFARLSNEQAAIILLHEALHFAGQTERHSGSRSLRGNRMTRMVMESCQLFHYRSR